MAPRARRDVPILLAASALLSFTSASRAAALALPELAFGAFFVGGVLRDTAGNAGPWIVVAVTLIGLAIRRLDLESWTLFIPGGLSGRVDRAFGSRAAMAASGVIIIERILLSALACIVFGHYCSSLLFTATGYARFLRNAMPAARRARHVWIAVGVLVLLLAWATVTALVRLAWPALPVPVPGMPPGGGWSDALGNLGWILIATLAALPTCFA